MHSSSFEDDVIVVVIDVISQFALKRTTKATAVVVVCSRFEKVKWKFFRVKIESERN